MRLSNELGNEWRSLGIFLGLSRAQLERCRLDNPGNIQSAIFDMLIKWRDQTPPEKQVANLVQALKEVGRLDLAEKFEYGAIERHDLSAFTTDILNEQHLEALETTDSFICNNIDEAVIDQLNQQMFLFPKRLYLETSSLINLIKEQKNKKKYDSLCDALKKHGQDFILREMQKAADNFLRETRDQSSPTEKEMVDVDPTIKVVILGETEAGKTSLCKSIIEGENVMEPKADRTIGVDICRYKDKETNIQYEIYDFGGHDVYHYTHRFFLTRHAIYITSTDLPSYNSAEFQKRLGTWLTSVTTHVMNPAIIIVGTKADQFDPKTAKEDIEKTCSQIKTDVEDFEKRFRDLLTDDIKRCQDALDRISNGDQPGEQFTGLSKEDIADKKASLETLLKGRPTSLQDVEVVPVSVNPENPQGLDKLLKKMAEMTKDKALFPNISQQVPKSWIDLREELKNTEDKKYISLDDCVKMAEPLQMTKEDVLNALSYWYVAGQILFYSNIEEVKNLVFPDPTGILELFKDLFRHNMEEYLAGIACGEEFQRASSAFLETGTADDVFLQGVLGSKRKDFDVMFPILKHFGLCYSGSVKFPPQLPELSNEDMKDQWPELKPSHVEVTVNIDYHAEPPVGLTESMISRIVSTDIGETSSKLLRRNAIILQGSGKAVLCRRRGQTGDQIKVRAEPNKAWQLCQNLGKVVQDAQEEYLALHCTISIRQQNGLHLKELPFEVLKRHTPAELIRLSHGKDEGLLTDGDKPTEQKMSVPFGKYYIENQLYEKICDRVGPEWLRLGTTLGLSTSALDNIQFSGYGNDTQRVFQTLKVFWSKAAHGHLYKLKRLQDVLLEMGKTDLSKFAEDISKEYTDCLPIVSVNPEETTDEQGNASWSVSLSREGKYVCKRTDLGVITPYPLDVTYKADNWSDHWKEPDEDWVAVGPLFDIRCDGVEGQVTLLLPHALNLKDKTDLSPEQTKVVHLVPGKPPELLKAEITPTHFVTQFKKGSQFGNVLAREEANSIPWNALFSLFMSPEKRHGTRLKAYIVPNLKTVQEALEEDEAKGKRKFECWDHIVCTLKPGETYCLKGNGNNIKIEPKFPAGVEFLATVDSRGYYKSFRVRVGKSTEAADAELELQLLNSAEEVVCTFTEFIDAGDGDMEDSDSGLSTDSIPNASGTSSAAQKQEVSRRKKTSVTPNRLLLHTPPKVLLISDRFGAYGDDMSTINLQVALLLYRYGAIVYSTVLDATPEDEKRAEDNDIWLIKPVRKPGDTRPSHLDWLTYDFGIRYPHLPDVDFVVGYADITSTAAKNIHEDKRVCPRSKLVLFNCEMPEEAAKYRGGKEAQTAAQKIVDSEAKNAHAVFSVGTRILEHFKSKYKKFEGGLTDKHHVYLPEPSQEFKDTNVAYGSGEIVVLSVGKVIDKEKTEGHDLAGQTMGIVAEDPEIKRLQWRACEIAPNDYERSKEILEDNLKSAKLKPTLLPYTTQQYIIDNLKTAHLVLMPSRAEPFGMFALEAITAGVPVLISDKSGLADMILDLIKEKRIDARYRSQIVETSVHEGEDQTKNAAVEWAKKIKDILKHLQSEFENAGDFKKELLNSKYWEQSQEDLLRVFGLAPKPQAD